MYVCMCMCERERVCLCEREIEYIHIYTEINFLLRSVCEREKEYK